MLEFNITILYYRSIIQIDLQSGVNADGHLKTDLKKCRAFIGELRLDFKQTDLDLLRNYLPLIHRAIREQIDNVSLIIIKFLIWQ